jgi:hypothetical protein
MTKPTKYPEWATDVTAIITEPTNTKKQQGWVAEKPPEGYFNWLQNLTYEWIKFFDEGGASGITSYDALSNLESLASTDLTDKQKFYIRGFGVYEYVSSSTDTVSMESVILPSDSIGRFLLILPHPDKVDADFEGEISAIEEAIGELKETFSNIETITFTEIPGNSSQDKTVTISNADVGDNIVLGLPSSLEAGLSVIYYAVTAANTVTIRLHNLTANPIIPASASYRITIFKF